MGDYLKEVEEQLVELTERGAHRRPRPRLDVLGLVAATVVVGAVAVAVATIGKNAHRPSTATHRSSTRVVPHHGTTHVRTRTVSSSGAHPGSPPVGGPVPVGFGPQSFTAISEFTWWLLGSAPCSSPPCTSIVRTTDGGRTFVGIPAPRSVPGANGVSQLRFADTQNGFAYGPELWVTHDGGGHWQQWALPGDVRDLAIGGGYAYAILTDPSTGSGQLLRSPVGGNLWKTMSGAGDAYGGLWVHGSYVLLEAQNARGQNLMISIDHGDHFTSTSVPPSVACQFEMPAPPVIWAHCATGTLSGTWRSVNEGRSFVAVSGPTELPNSAAFGSASATTAVVGYRQLYQTANGGASWSPVTGPSGITWWQYIGFTDPTHGVAIGYVGSAAKSSNERLYYTTDGGASYHLVTIG